MTLGNDNAARKIITKFFSLKQYVAHGVDGVEIYMGGGVGRINITKHGLSGKKITEKIPNYFSHI